MRLDVREMNSSEVDLVIDYFHRSSPEHLEMLGVDPTRLPPVDAWRSRLEQECSLPYEKRAVLYLIWLGDGSRIGFSSCDRIHFGDRANMHLHVAVPEHRNRGLGTECVKQSVAQYFDRLRLKRLFCEPNAFNVAPNRTLQKAGFKYVKTHLTVPGPLNFHQAVTKWMIERPR